MSVARLEARIAHSCEPHRFPRMQKISETPVRAKRAVPAGRRTRQEIRLGTRSKSAAMSIVYVSSLQAGRMPDLIKRSIAIDYVVTIDAPDRGERALCGYADSSIALRHASLLDGRSARSRHDDGP
jgi:hypothetical protein